MSNRYFFHELLQGTCASPEKDSKIYWGNSILRRNMFLISPDLRLGFHVVYNFTFSPKCCLFWCSWSSFFFLLWQVKWLSKWSSKDKDMLRMGPWKLNVNNIFYCFPSHFIYGLIFLDSGIKYIKWGWEWGPSKKIVKDTVLNK